MSVQFGGWNLDGRPFDREYLTKAGEMLAPYGPDGRETYIKDTAGILFRAFHTTKESRKERQPLVTPSGTVICWDGRLDNREGLLRDLRGSEGVGTEATDLAIVAATYTVWGAKCFARLIGDWALSIWDPAKRSLLLAKDVIGTRHLYYSFDQEQIRWSTILDPLVLLAGKQFALEEEYIAGWLSYFPATHLTPYAGIHSVPPSCVVTLEPGRHTVTKYWDFDPAKTIRYGSDGEYEEHFQELFAGSVRRRLRSDGLILAELSGGMDSSSIVCMADIVLARGEGETTRLDTVSYYNDSEPNWNEKPYFTKVEEKRGRAGCHINVDSDESLRIEFGHEHFFASPASVQKSNRPSDQFSNYLTEKGHRVLLSGIAGDEVTGGVPTPIPELEDLLVRRRGRTLTHQLKIWALNKRKPWSHLLLEAVREFLPLTLAGVSKHTRPLPWLNSDFATRHRAALRGYGRRLEWFGPLPSFQHSSSTLEALRGQLACSMLLPNRLLEKRYPYLDRDFLEFLYAVPREQLVRPGERRSLMRRALVGIVPQEILGRRRKAYVARRPLALIASEAPRLLELSRHLVSSSFEIVEGNSFRCAIEIACRGQEIQIVGMLRTLMLEAWLQASVSRCVLTHPCSHDGLQARAPLLRANAAGASTRTSARTTLSASRKDIVFYLS